MEWSREGTCCYHDINIHMSGGVGWWCWWLLLLSCYNYDGWVLGLPM